MWYLHTLEYNNPIHVCLQEPLLVSAGRYLRSYTYFTFHVSELLSEVLKVHSNEWTLLGTYIYTPLPGSSWCIC